MISLKIYQLSRVFFGTMHMVMMHGYDIWRWQLCFPCTKFAERKFAQNVEYLISLRAIRWL